jgi:hypothetical protein
MKTLIYLFFATAILVECCGQNNNSSINIKKEKIMKKFDAKRYENLPLDSTQRNTEKNKTYISGNKRIQVEYEKDSTVFVSETEINSPYSNRKRYYISTNKNQLSAEIKYFNGMPIGICKEYDEDGNVIKETDFDENYYFSIQQLIEKMENDFGIDLITPKNSNNQNEKLQIVYGVGRDNSSHSYIVQISNGMHYRRIIIDGKNGEVISDKTGNYEK